MANDPTLPVRRAILTHLKADAAVTALIPAERLYAEATPDPVEWPFGRYGASSSLPLRAACLDGATISVAYHVFAKGAQNDACAKVAAAVAKSLDGPEGKGLPLALEDDAGAAVAQVVGTQILRDTDEASAWHGIVNLEVTVTA